MNKRGNATIEAALILPLVFLIVAGVISASFTLCDRVKDHAADNRSAAAAAPGVSDRILCDLVRGRWLLQ